jgi:hypothetical protein
MRATISHLLLWWNLSVCYISEHFRVHEEYSRCVYEGKTTSGDGCKYSARAYGHSAYTHGHVVTLLLVTIGGTIISNYHNHGRELQDYAEQR